MPYTVMPPEARIIGLLSPKHLYCLLDISDRQLLPIHPAGPEVCSRVERLDQFDLKFAGRMNRNTDEWPVGEA